MSSVNVVNPADVIVGSMTDSRNGQTYKTVTIGSQTWMAENLNFETENSWCYNESSANCTKYGRLYAWTAAVGRPAGECGYGKTCSLPSGTIQGVCPSGWHLPSKAEWDTLFRAVGGRLQAGTVLKSTSGWEGNGNGTDAYEFSVLPAGNKDGGFADEGVRTWFWTSTDSDDEYAYYMSLYYNFEDVMGMADKRKDAALSVRCLKGSDAMPQSSSSEAEPLTDSRDGQTYKTVVIGSQTWMAENLNYNVAESYCYDDDPSYCDMYGRLYSWGAAMDSTGMWTSNGVGCGFSNTCSPTYPVRGVCPEGWHLPSKDDFETLVTTVGKSNLGDALKSNSGWANEGHGSDTYGFTALPAGFWDNGYLNMRYVALFASSTETSTVQLYTLNLTDTDSELSNNAKHLRYSVRCVKD